MTKTKLKNILNAKHLSDLPDRKSKKRFIRHKNLKGYLPDVKYVDTYHLDKVITLYFNVFSNERWCLPELPSLKDIKQDKKLYYEVKYCSRKSDLRSLRKIEAYIVVHGLEEELFQKFPYGGTKYNKKFTIYQYGLIAFPHLEKAIENKKSDEESGEVELIIRDPEACPNVDKVEKVVKEVEQILQRRKSQRIQDKSEEETISEKEVYSKIIIETQKRISTLETLYDTIQQNNFNQVSDIENTISDIDSLFKQRISELSEKLDEDREKRDDMFLFLWTALNTKVVVPKNIFEKQLYPAEKLKDPFPLGKPEKKYQTKSIDKTKDQPKFSKDNTFLCLWLVYFFFFVLFIKICY